MLETSRLTIRPFVMNDLLAIHHILNECFGAATDVEHADSLAERHSWLQWNALNQEWLPKMHQPPYGDRGVVLKKTGTLIGAVGFVPLIGPYDQIPALGTGATPSGYSSAEVGLFWAIDPQHQGQGYATEAARALIEYAFDEWRLRHIIAATEYENHASQAVMRKLGMTVARNPFAEPAWLQVVGVLLNS